MNATTFDAVLTSAARLSDEEQQLLADLLRKRQIEKWRAETAAEGRRAVKAVRAGKLKAQSADSIISELRASLTEED
jgi:hypothetical protein